MPPRIDFLHYIVPLTFLAIWALTSLFNREAQPLPPRTGRAPNPPGPRPGGGLVSSPRPPERRPEPINRDPSQRWANPTAPPARRPSGRPDDDILIIESEPRRSSSPSPPRPATTSAPKRPARARSAVPVAKRPEPAPARTMATGMGGLTHPLARLQEIDLHKDSFTPPPVQEGRDLSKLAANDPPRTMFRPGAISFDAQAALISPGKLREAFILNEVLRPPVALRGPRPRA